jgi:hypothetical protein
MKRIIKSLEALEYEGLFPITTADAEEIERELAAEIEVTFNENDLRVYCESGIWIADLERREEAEK